MPPKTPALTLSKTALKFLSCADQSYQGRSHGTHHHNLKGFYGKLLDGGYIAHQSEGSPFVHLTDMGRNALHAYYATGGKKA